MNDPQTQLEELGLSSSEANVYLTLVRAGGTLGASAVSASTGIPRTNVYPILNSLADKGIVEAEAGYGSRFAAISPDVALPSLVAREQDEQQQRLSHQKRVAGELMQQLRSLIAPAAADLDAEQIQVFRDPRVAVDRFKRLELEAQRTIDVFTKAPFFGAADNPAQLEALQRGVRVRGLYESAVLVHPEIEPYLAKWLARGEEARLYDGELPHKLAIFDEQNILLPLVTPGRPTRTLFIRHPQLARSLGIMFETLWERAAPLALGAIKKPPASRRRLRKHADGSRGGIPVGNERRA